MLKVELVGDDAVIEQLLNSEKVSKDFSKVKISAEETRVRASDHFSRKQWDRAVKLYQCILENIEITETKDDKGAAEKKDFIIQINTNLAICYNLKGDWSNAMSHVRYIESLCSIDNQPKILYAKGRALMMLGENPEALAALKKALKLRPLDKQISQAVEELDKRKESYENFQKTFAKNLKLN